MKLRVDIFKVTERILYAYPKIVDYLADKQLETQFISAVPSFEVIDRNLQSDKTANAALAHCDNAAVQELEKIIFRINKILALRKEYQELFRVRYIVGLRDWEQIAEAVGKSERQCQLYRRKIVETIAKEINLNTLSIVYEIL